MKSSIKYIVMADTESGGLPSKEKAAFDTIALVECAFVVIDCEKLEICEEASFILEDNYKEGLIYDYQAEAVHGITKAIRQSKGIPLKDGFKITKDILKKYKNTRFKAVFGGHNFQKFDIPFFENFFKYMGDDLYNYIDFVEDTMKIAYYSASEQENYKLGTCCQLAGVDLVDAHRAGADTYANALLMIEYLKRMRGAGQQQVLTQEKKVRFRESFQLM